MREPTITKGITMGIGEYVEQVRHELEVEFMTARQRRLFSESLAIAAEVAEHREPSCMEAEHGGHLWCPHVEEMVAELRERAEKAEAERDELRRARDTAEDALAHYRRK